MRRNPAAQRVWPADKRNQIERRFYVFSWFKVIDVLAVADWQVSVREYKSIDVIWASSGIPHCKEYGPYTLVARIKASIPVRSVTLTVCCRRYALNAAM